MAECKVKDVLIGKGKPKVCLPIVGKNDEDVLTIAKSFLKYQYDLVELRIDFYENIRQFDKVLNLLKNLRQVIQQPIIFTYRSLKEGGQIQLNDSEYIELIQRVCENGNIDIVDVEAMSGHSLVMQLINIAHQNHVKVILSNHDFKQTPSIQEMRERIEMMEILGGDILKLAVMPQVKKDVIDVISLTAEMSEKVNKPLVTMSMDHLGVVTRICGELTGSSITFASVNQASAPGQIGVEDMNMILETIHHD